MKKQACILFALFYFCFGLMQAQKKVEFLNSLKSREDFDLLKGEPLNNNFKGIECIKLIYVLADQKIYYLESKKYRYHYRFTSEVFNDTDDLETFNDLNYGKRPGRKYILATFNYNVNTKNYFLQFAPSDDPSDELIATLVTKVEGSFFKGDHFKILLNTTTLLRRKKELEKKHKVFTSDELFKNQVYQPIYKGKAKGILRIIDADSLKRAVNYSDCILLLHGSSNEIPVCRGLVTDEFQTPLSHICLLTTNRKTPCAANKKIAALDSLPALENEMVELIVGNEGMSIKRAAMSAGLAQKKKKLVKLDADTSVKKIADLNTIRYKNRKAFGSKAGNLAELKKLERLNQASYTPKAAFAIPFFYYLKHVNSHRIDSMVKALTLDSLCLGNDSLLDLRLKKIRTAIRCAGIDTSLLGQVTRMCASRFGKNKVRFRSSSNCEDEANFNGAGLYTSETGIVGDTGKTIEKAIKKVWASLWSLRAFKEREFFNIDHSTVAMGILVHGAFDNELVNGVAVTKNLYRDYEAGFVINMQKGENEVVSPKQGLTCEQVVSYMNTGSDFYNANRSADWISFSSLNPSGSLLSSEELFELTKLLEIMKQHFYKVYSKWPQVEYKDFALDVEFKIIMGKDQKKQIIIKQVRPYNN
ncbi:MAG: PEP/pyruvate-binding domain-containing protein [Bacteroidia bacterium]